MTDEIRLTSRRERGKDARRSRIVEAAYALLREVGADDLSVKMIADRADLSPATVYNLFGAKGAVLAKVYARDFEVFIAKVEGAGSPSALDAIFDSIRITMDHYRSDPPFYRGMSIRNPRAEPELVIAVQGPRQAFWRDLLARAVCEGDLAPGVRTDMVSLAMLQMSGGVFGYWCADLISLDEMEQQTLYSFALLLMGLARPAGRARLQARVAAIQAAAAPLCPTATAG
ncbi:TetR/AcrR family transcriptional regulator [uncultured Phenylobacterium sp.]|uniref:TetR/AcrR family transcriptional regulator n=1 Tax=uncultured Phenylobacterium sp. TaxID=349273 RepID=UPI0025DB5699|nr:helix-turn-helix domain-containing protein [uncultured Phenylobacterium sp.]